MSETRFELATAADDPGIRRLLVNNPVPGRITVTYEREPDYFLGCGTMGHFSQVLIARHVPTGEIIGLACRATRPLFINGTAEEVGYVGQLRVDRRFRGRWLLALGMKFARELHSDGRVAGYITTIIEGNEVAKGVLVDYPRRYHPAYREVSQIHTLVLMLRRPKRSASSRYEAGCGSSEDLREIVSFLATHGRGKQFFPAYTLEDFEDGVTTPGFAPEDFVVARRDGEIVGVLGLWDQSSYKQTVVRAYSGGLRIARPWFNVAARLSRRQPLPRPGQPIHYVHVSFICVENNSPEIFRELLEQAYGEAFSRGYHYLALGLDSCDPLLREAKAYRHITYCSRLYTVCWDDEGEFHERLDGRIPYVELAAL